MRKAALLAFIGVVTFMERFARWAPKKIEPPVAPGKDWSLDPSIDWGTEPQWSRW